jgi:uncharacterized protein
LIFIDTTIFVSAADLSDTLHADGIAVLRAIDEGKLSTAVTTDFIIDEVLTLLRKRHAKSDALSNFAENALRFFTIVYIDENLLKESFANFRKYDKMSFTDAVSLTVMKKYKIKEIFSHDTDFDLKGIIRKERS